MIRQRRRARGAYQAGVLVGSAILLDVPKAFPFPVLTGMSAGAINTVGLVEGVLNHNGQLERFLYFQRVDPDDRQVTLRAALVDTTKGETFGTASIPLRLSPTLWAEWTLQVQG